MDITTHSDHLDAAAMLRTLAADCEQAGITSEDLKWILIEFRRVTHAELPYHVIKAVAAVQGRSDLTPSQVVRSLRIAARRHEIEAAKGQSFGDAAR